MKHSKVIPLIEVSEKRKTRKQDCFAELTGHTGQHSATRQHWVNCRTLPGNTTTITNQQKQNVRGKQMTTNKKANSVISAEAALQQ